MSDAGGWEPAVRVAPRVHTGELISTAAAIGLFGAMFLLGWFGVVSAARLQRSGSTTAIGAWDAMPVIRWLLLASALAALASTALHASQRRHGARTATGLPLLLIAAPTAVLAGYRVLISPPDPTAIVDTKLGAYLGLLAVVAVAIGALESAREERDRDRLAAAQVGRSRRLARRPAAQ